MSQTRTLAQIREEVRQRADIENATTWIDTDEVNRYINEAIREFWDLLLEAHGHEWYLNEVSFTTTANQDEYDLYSEVVAFGNSPDFYILKGLDITRNGKRYPLRPYSFLEREDADNYALSDGFPRHYRLHGSAAYPTGEYSPYLRLQPTPDAAYTITIIYVPTAPYLEDDTDVWNGHNGWEEYVVVDAAIRCLEKEESDTEALQLRKAKLEQRIRNIAGQRDWSFKERVTDVHGRHWGGPWWGVE